MGRMTVADISRWQGSIDFGALVASGQVQGVVTKVGGADGGLYVDSMFGRNRHAARAAGLPQWFYWYKSGPNARQQAEYMLQAVGTLQPGEAIVLDDENETTVNVAFCAAFADRVKELTGLTIVVYSNQARFQNVNVGPLKDRNIGAWVAKYGRNDGSLAGAGQAPAITTLPIIMWQYTSAARVPGITANTVDLNVFYGDVDAFRLYGALGPVTAPTPTPVPQAPVVPSAGTYTVAAGDTLSGIGSKLGLDWRTVAAWNGIVAPWTIWPGQVLRTYGGAAHAAAQPSAGGATYIVVPGDTLSGIAAKAGGDWRQLAEANGLKPPYLIYPGQKLTLSRHSDTVASYTVVPGDTLSGIGGKTGKAWQDIARWNGLVAPYTIYPNQVLRLG